MNTYHPFVLALLLALSACAGPRQYFSAPDANLPFSKAVLSGNTLYVAGHLGLDPSSGQAPADPAVEAGLMLDDFAKTLARAEMGMNDLVQVQVFCSDVGLYQTFNDIYRQRFAAPFPARAFIGSGKLLRGARFEMLGIAVRR